MYPSGRAADRLAEDQDDQQGEPLRQVFDVQRQPVVAEGGDDRTHGIDEYRNRPQHVLGVAGHGQRHSPQRGAHADEEQIDPDGGPALLDVAPGPCVHQQQDQPAGQIAGGERDGQLADRVGRAGSAARDRGGRGQLADPEHDVVGVEAVGVQREADPGEPDRHEQSDQDTGAVPTEVAVEGLGELHHHQHVGEVEEEFEPAGIPLAAEMQARRPDERFRTRTLPGLGHRDLCCGCIRGTYPGDRPGKPRSSAAGSPTRSLLPLDLASRR